MALRAPTVTRRRRAIGITPAARRAYVISVHPTGHVEALRETPGCTHCDTCACGHGFCLRCNRTCEVEGTCARCDDDATVRRGDKGYCAAHAPRLVLPSLGKGERES